MNLLRAILDLDLPVWAFVAAKATGAILVAFAAGALARRARASLRHAVYAALFVLLLLLPFASRLMPAMNVTVPVNGAGAQRVLAGPPAGGRTAGGGRLHTEAVPAVPLGAVTTNAVTSAALSQALTAVYLAGVLFLFASLVAGIVRLRRFAAWGEVWLDGTRLAAEVACANGIRRGVLVVLSDAVPAPMTFGFRRQTIVVPALARDWDDGALRRALRHEIEHVRRDDWAMQLIARLAVAVYWPHPLVWMALRRFVAEAERTCDDAVVRSFEPSTYAEQLVGLARTLARRPGVPALAMASPTRLSERVHAILDPRQRRGPHGRLASLAMVAAMAAVLGLFGSVRLVAAAADNGARNDGAKNGPSKSANKVDATPSGGDDVNPNPNYGDGVNPNPNYGDGIDPNPDPDDPYVEMVIRAAERGDIRRIESVLSHGLDVNRTFDGDGTMLLIAARNGRRQEVQYLLDRGADPNVPSPGDGNPLIAAAGNGRVAIVELLLNRGARIDDVVPGDENALITAAGRGFADVVELLIARGADVNLGVRADGERGLREWRTPLNMARKHGHDDVVRLLLAAGARE